jgi:undecaprenyl-phosphate galactose phosphotransferase
MLTKHILDLWGLWQRDTWIIGSGPNAHEAYKAINSEHNLGLKIVGFIDSSDNSFINGKINNIQLYLMI